MRPIHFWIVWVNLFVFSFLFLLWDSNLCIILQTYSTFLCGMFGGVENECALRHYSENIDFATKNILTEMQLVTFKIHSRFVHGLRLRSKSESCKFLYFRGNIEIYTWNFQVLMWIRSVNFGIWWEGGVWRLFLWTDWNLSKLRPTEKIDL